MNSNSSYSQETPNSGQNQWFLVPCDFEIFWMTLKNNRAPLLCYFKLCALFHNHRLIQTRVTVRKSLIWVKKDDFWSCASLKFDGWPWKTIGHFFYATSSCAHHFVAICKSKLEFRSRNAQTEAKFALTSVTLTFELWPWHFAWTSLLSMVTTPENFMMILQEEHSEKGVKDRQMDGKKCS